MLVIRPDTVAASTIIVQRGTSIGVRQLGSLAQTVFRSEVVQKSAAQDLGLPDTSPLLEQAAELIPLPDSPGLIVLGLAETDSEAASNSEIFARALVDALNRQVEGEEFLIFGEPQFALFPHGISGTVAVGSGAITGFWLGMSYAVLHYRWKRPVLTLWRALAVTGAAQLAILDVGRFSWLGHLSDGFKSTRASSNGIRLTWLARPRIAGEKVQGVGSAPAVHVNQLGSDLESKSMRAGEGGEVLVITARAGTGERELTVSRLAIGGTEMERAGRVGLVWVR